MTMMPERPAHTHSRQSGYTRRLAAATALMSALALISLTPSAAWADTGTTSTTSPPATLPLPTTTVPPSSGPAATTTTTQSAKPGATTTTTKPKPVSTTTTPGVPAVPVGGPPTTVAPPGAPPLPPPDPQPILDAVRDDLTQLAAIDDYRPAQQVVTAAQMQVTQAGAALQSARSAVAQAQAYESAAGQNKLAADSQLRKLAIAAYVGVSYSTPGVPAGATAANGTVSTPEGLTGVEALDAQEMLELVGKRARQVDQQARETLAQSAESVKAAEAGYQKAQAAVAAAESTLLSAQQTLKTITAAAVTPGAATASPLPVLDSASPAQQIVSGLPGAPGRGAQAGTDGLPQAGAAPQVPGAPPTAVPPPTTTTLPRADQLAASALAPNLAPAPSPTILGQAVMTPQELAAWYASTARQANTTVPIGQLTQDYADWGQATGVRYDIAFAQSIVETGFFSFPANGQLTAQDNNFAGIGACDTCTHGWSFPNAAAGVGAQLELLEAYATKGKVDTQLVGPVGVGGCCSTWMALAGKWASSIVYGISIMTIYQQMLTWLIPQREMAAGLIATTTTAAQGPELAPLPQPPAPTTTTTSTTVPPPAKH